VPEEEGREAHRLPAQAAPEAHHDVAQEGPMKHADTHIARALVERLSA
jgi:hypothetical protein